MLEQEVQRESKGQSLQRIPIETEAQGTQEEGVERLRPVSPTALE